MNQSLHNHIITIQFQISVIYAFCFWSVHSSYIGSEVVGRDAPTKTATKMNGIILLKSLDTSMGLGLFHLLRAENSAVLSLVSAW